MEFPLYVFFLFYQMFYNQRNKCEPNTNCSFSFLYMYIYLLKLRYEKSGIIRNVRRLKAKISLCIRTVLPQ